MNAKFCDYACKVANISSTMHKKEEGIIHIVSTRSRTDSGVMEFSTIRRRLGLISYHFVKGHG
jgi:hypothetical protein